MFTDQNNNQQPEKDSYYYQQPPSSFSRGTLIILFIVVFIIFIGVALIYKYIPKKQTAQNQEEVKQNEQEVTSTPASTSTTSPAVNTLSSAAEVEGESEVDLPKAENLTFGDFYKREENLPAGGNILQLPLNVKTGVANYYDIARRINLEPKVTDLNSSGFTVLNNPFAPQFNDFFSVYEEMRKKGMPIFITSDFLLYYYQNIAKETFDEIQSDIFYQKVWSINKKMFEIANSRYKERRTKKGIVNEPILEAERMEAAYFATVLELLDLSDEKTGQGPQSGGTALGGYNFTTPDYLTPYVKKEVDLIKEAKKIEMSPIFLYYRDYKDFIISETYKSNPRLKHFALAMKWLNSNFPLYYKDAVCPDCLLAKEDWQVSFITANLIARDFKDNQELANDWAKIYKVISFFSGLRRDLTYLTYRNAAIKLFGDNYEIEKIFSLDKDGENNIFKLREEISKRRFLLIQGGFKRDEIAERKKIGMRMLQDTFWPSDYIFNELIYPQVGTTTIENINKKTNITYCSTREKNKYERCRAIALDTVNLLFPISSANGYFKENTNYENYRAQSEGLKSELLNFNVNDWHNNIFWSNLSMAKYFLETDKNKSQTFSQPAWHEKNINTVLGAWTNLQLPSEVKIISVSKALSNLSLFEESKSLHYVEPNLILADEILANARMLRDALLALNAIQKTDTSYARLSNFISELENIKQIVKKEINNEALTREDQKNILDLMEKSISKDTIKKSTRILKLNFNNGNWIFEKVEGVRLLLIVYQEGDSNYFALGPVFNYEESIK